MRTLTKWSLADYQSMRRLGILDHRRCELINGEIWDMAPEGSFHRFVNHRGVNYLRALLVDKAEVFEAHPVTLATSEPQPDIAIVQRPDTRYLKHHPYPEDIYWLVEIADSTLNYDLTIKRDVYAAAEIQEYWVIDVAGRQMTVFRDPLGGEYLSQTVYSDGVIYPVAFSDVAIALNPFISIPE